MLPRSTALLLALALPSACTSPSANTSEGSSSTAVADDSSSTADSSASVTASTTDTTGPTSSTSSMTGNTMSTTDPSSSTGPQGCQGDDECDGPANPICIDQVCSPCESDAQCQAKDPTAPACRDDGQCVQCTASNDDGCGGATPVCDAAASACVGCTFHEQCPESACRMATGECFDAADVVHVDADDGDNLGAEFVDGVVIVLHNYGTTTPYNVNLDLDGGVAAILAAVGDAPRIQGLDGGASITVRNGGELYVANGVQVVGSTETMYPGIAVDGAAVYVDRSRVVQNDGGGISLENGAYAQVRNAFIGGANNRNAASISGSTIELLYSTLGGQFGNSTGLTCDMPSTVTIRNSLILSQDAGAYACDEPNVASFSVSIDALPGSNNVQIPIGNFDFAMDFGGYDSGNFALNASAPAEILTAAQWNSGDPLVDIDGDARPGVDGSADVAGADIP